MSEPGTDDEPSIDWERVFRIPLPVAVFLWLTVMFLLSRAFTNGFPMEETLLLVAVGAGFMLAVADQWWSVAVPPREQLRLVIVAAVAARLMLVATPPVFSDDIFRYVWEGRVSAQDGNPFALAPDAPALSALRDAEIWPRINHPEISAIYPPLAQSVFALIAAFGGGVVAMKLFFVAVDLLVALALWRWLEVTGLPRGRIVLWLLHPLVLIEFAGSGHLDALVALGLALTMLATARLAAGVSPARNALGAVGGLALAAMAKLAPIAFLPHLARHLRPRHWWILALAPAMLAVSYLPFASAGGGLVRALDHYESRWQNNASVFLALVEISRTIDPGGSRFRATVDGLGSIAGVDELSARVLRRRADSIPGDPNLVLARWMAYAAFGVLWFWVLARVDWPWDERWAALMAGAFLLSPVVHPWYLTLLVPCLLRRFRPALLWWSIACIATYLPLERWHAEAIWEESRLAWWLQYGGMAAICAAVAWKGRVASRARR